MFVPGITTDTRRHAIARAARAVVRLAARPDLHDPVYRQNVIVNDIHTVNDRQAWDAVVALEDLIVAQGLIGQAEIEAERSADHPVPICQPTLTNLVRHGQP